MPYHERDVSFPQNGDRNLTRRQVVEAFLDEDPGTGKGKHTSRYRYNVERLEDGRRVYIVRPAWMKAGFDFVIHLEGANFGNGKTNPSHDDIFDDLRAKMGEDSVAAQRLYCAVARVHECADPEDVIRDCLGLSFAGGLSVEAILKIIKWFFIEQDIRYWSYSGRNMFMAGVRSLMGSGR